MKANIIWLEATKPKEHAFLGTDYVVIAGAISSGFTVYGMFNTCGEAEQWAQENMFENWDVMLVNNRDDVGEFD